MLRITYFQETIPADSAAPDFTIEPDGLSESADGLMPGDYLGGAVQGSFSIDYSGFDRWRKLLCKAALGYEAECVWSSPDAFKEEPFYEIIHCERRKVFGPETSSRLAHDFRKMEKEVDEKMSGETEVKHYQFFMDLYQLFRKAFQVAANSGCTIFS